MDPESSIKSQPERYRIGDLLLDTGRATVAREVATVALPKLSFDLLLCLARHAPNVVSTDTLMDEVWGKTVIGEETVKQRVKLLRQSLGDSSSNPVYFESVRGRGYRMIADVISQPEQSDGTSEHGKKPSPGKYGFALAIVLALSIAFAWFLFSPATVVVENRRVAVLPFSFIGASSQDDYLADGITEELITALAQMTDLRVIARTSVMRYKGTDMPVSEIGAELDVGTMLEGSVQRFGDELRVTVQMIDAASEEHYWAQTFDVSLTDLPRLQVELAERVAASLAATASAAGREAIMRNATDVPEAFELYLKGRAAYRQWTLQSNEAALAFYRQALVLDPEFALAIAGAANALALKAAEFGGDEQSARDAIVEANRALEINPDLPEAHKALGIVSFFEGRYLAAIEHYQEALRIEPNYDEALFNLAETCYVLGRWDEAVQYQMQDSFRPFGLERLSIYLRNLGFDAQADVIAAPLVAEIPVSFFGDENRSFHYLMQGEYERAREHARRMQEYFPGRSTGWVREGEIDLRAGDLVAAENNLQVAVNMPGLFNRYAKIRLAQLLLDRGEAVRAAALLKEVEIASLESIQKGHEAWYHRWNLSMIHALRGEREAALTWYERAVDAGRRRYDWDEQEGAFGTIADDPRFRAALERQRKLRKEMKERVRSFL